MLCVSWLTHSKVCLIMYIWGAMGFFCITLSLPLLYYRQKTARVWHFISLVMLLVLMVCFFLFFFCFNNECCSYWPHVSICAASLFTPRLPPYSASVCVLLSPRIQHPFHNPSPQSRRFFNTPYIGIAFNDCYGLHAVVGKWVFDERYWGLLMQALVHSFHALIKDRKTIFGDRLYRANISR